jgi:hypothetical protein
VARKPARREPTSSQAKKLRGLLTSAGSVAELARWTKIVQREPKGRRGAKAKGIDEHYLDGLMLSCLLAFARGKAPTTELRKTFERRGSAKEFGSSPNAVWRRIYRKLKNWPISEHNLTIARKLLTEDEIARFRREISGKFI